jgi:hypothetical protein
MSNHLTLSAEVRPAVHYVFPEGATQEIDVVELERELNATDVPMRPGAIGFRFAEFICFEYRESNVRFAVVEPWTHYWGVRPTEAELEAAGVQRGVRIRGHVRTVDESIIELTDSDLVIPAPQADH